MQQKKESRTTFDEQINDRCKIKSRWGSPKRLLATLLVFLMVMGMVPLTASALDPPAFEDGVYILM